MEIDANTLINRVREWGSAKQLNDPKAQLNKVIEEVGEIAHEVTRNQYGPEFSDAIGDTLVTVIILADMMGYNPVLCLQSAWDVVKHRTGKTIDGTFVKDE